MKFRGKSLSEITASDIISLVENKVPESKTLDYKREIKFGEKDKPELIYDISSFFNTEGGFIVVGLDEEKNESNNKTGIPKFPIAPKTVTSYDEIQRKIQDSIRNTTNPAITNLSFSRLLTIQETDVFIIGIPKTNSLPAMVTFSNHNRFYKRNSNGKYSLDTYELYETFTQISILEDRIARFITERQETVYSDNFLPGIGNINSILIHIVPINHFDSKIEEFSSYNKKKLFIDTLYPPGILESSNRYCFEGFQLYKNSKYYPYNLLFRNGAIETFTDEPFGNSNLGKIINGFQLIQIVKQQLQKAFNFYRLISIDRSLYLSVKLNQIKGRLLSETSLGKSKIENLIEMQFPITFLNDDAIDIKVKVKELFDVLWQTVDENECPGHMFNEVFKDFKI